MLFKKAVRSIWANKKAYLACVVLILIGIMMYTALSIASESLEISKVKYYKEYNMADVFVKLEDMPTSLVLGLYDIKGIKEVVPRYVVEARAETDDTEEIIVLRLIALDNVEEMRMNKILIEGEPLLNPEDLIVNSNFFAAHNLAYGDTVSLFLNGREYVCHVVASSLSPEYVYIVKNAMEMLPDVSGFGIGYITAEMMNSMTGKAGYTNDILITLEEGYTFEDVKIDLEDALDPYGLKELIARKDQLSHSMLQMELDSIKSVSLSIPMVFVLLAIIVLYLMLKRVIEQERTQIGTLKAFGYSNPQILLHYLSYGGVTGFVGGIFGWLFGYLMSGPYVVMYSQFFNLPNMAASFNLRYLVISILIGTIGGILGAFAGAIKVLGLNPAEAMRPESPKEVKFDLVGKMKWLTYLLTSRGNMALRNITRNLVRSSFIVVGIMFSFSLLAFVGSISSMIDKMIYSQFTDIQKYDVKITLNSPLDYTSAVETVYAIEGVGRAEGLLEIPVELVNKHIRSGIVMTGIEENAELYRIFDTNRKIAYSPPTQGIILTNGIADKLKVKTGDTIFISSSLIEKEIPIKIVRVIEQNLGSGCYMEIQTLGDLFNQGVTATSILVETGDIAYLKDYLKNSANAMYIEDSSTTLKKYQEMMGPYESLYFFLEVMGMFVAFAIIYNTSTISLSERKREYATLRVIGLSVNEVCEIMNFEYWILSVIAILLGIPFTSLLNQSVNLMVDTSMYSMPSTIQISAYLVGAIGCISAIMLSNLSAKKNIRKFDMVEVLKERE